MQRRALLVRRRRRLALAAAERSPHGRQRDHLLGEAGRDRQARASEASARRARRAPGRVVHREAKREKLVPQLGRAPNLFRRRRFERLLHDR